MAALLSTDELAASLAAAPGWTLNRTEIARTFVFRNFVGAMKFVNAAADLAEAANHHPDIDIRWNRVTLRLSTHNKGGLTALDFDLAKKIDNIV